MKSVQLFLILFGVILFSGWLFVENHTQNFIYILNEKDFELESKSNNLPLFDLILPQVFGVTLSPTQHFDSFGSEENSNDIWLINSNKKPNKPTNLQVTHIGNQQVSLSWIASSNPGHTAIIDYKIEQKGSSGGWGTVSTQNGNEESSIATIATVTGLTNGQSYDFQVTAENNAGYGTSSRTISATPTNSGPVPDKPTNLAATGINATSIALSWNTPSNDGGNTIIGYNIERNLNSDGFIPLVYFLSSEVLNYSDTKLSSSDTVQYRVTAVNIYGNGSTSTATSLIILHDVIVPKTINISDLIDAATNSTFSVYYTISEKSLENSIVKIDLPSDLFIYKSVDSDTLIKIVQYTGAADLSNISGTLSGSLVDIGDPSYEMNFDKAVKVTLFGKAGNSAFYIDSDNVTHMINQCIETLADSAAATTYLKNNSIRECYHDSDSDLIIWTTHFTGFGSTSSVLNSNSKKSGGDDNAWMSKPTFGLSHKTNSPIVQCGFSWNDICYDITDNWHTPFEKVDVTTGTQYNMTMKAYFEHPPLFMEFVLVPELGKFNEFETKIEVIFENNFNTYYKTNNSTDISIKSITVISKDNLIDQSLLGGTISKVSCGFVSSDCYELSINGFMFREKPFFEKIGILVADTERRFQITYLNEGFDIEGVSLNPVPIDTITHHSKKGSFQIIQLNKFANLWFDEDGITYTSNDTGTWIRLTPYQFVKPLDMPTNVITRVHSDFPALLEQQKLLAEQKFTEKYGTFENKNFAK